jgi:hypothetical protein
VLEIVLMSLHGIIVAQMFLIGYRYVFVFRKIYLTAKPLAAAVEGGVLL